MLSFMVRVVVFIVKNRKKMFKKAGVKVTHKDSGKHAVEMKKNRGGNGVPYFYSLKTKKILYGLSGNSGKVGGKVKLRY